MKQAVKNTGVPKTNTKSYSIADITNCKTKTSTYGIRKQKRQRRPEAAREL